MALSSRANHGTAKLMTSHSAPSAKVKRLVRPQKAWLARSDMRAIVAAQRACRLPLCQTLPGLDDRVGVQRDRHDAFLGQPVGEVGVVAGALAADADVLAGGAAGGD